MSEASVKTIDRDNLPIAVERMGLHRKTALTPMVAIDGPFTCITQEGPYHLPAGWQGFVAVDREGFPYPVSLDAYHSTYAPASESPKDQITRVLIAHQRKDEASCLCGWAVWGASHAEHVAEVLAEQVAS